MNLGPSGFYKAPVTKAVFVGVAASTLGVHLLGRDHLFNLVLSPQILQEGQVHRLLTHPWFFRTSAEALFGGVLLYQLRIIERRYGSHKFASFVVLTTALSTLFQIMTLWTVGGSGVWSTLPVAPGPYGLLFALVVQYAFDIPITTTFHLGGLSLSYKSIMYLFAGQLLLAAPGGALSAMSGIAAGLIYRTFGAVRRWRVPALLSNAASKYLMPLLASAPPSTRLSTDASAEGARRPVVISSPRSAAVPAPPEEHITHLIGMGFSRESAVRALRQTRNDVQRAVNLLADEALSQ